MNGTLIKTWEVHCFACERPLLGIGRFGSSPEAAEDARREGWRIRGGKWRCEPCVAVYERPKRASQVTAGGAE